MLETMVSMMDGGFRVLTGLEPTTFNVCKVAVFTCLAMCMLSCLLVPFERWMMRRSLKKMYEEEQG